MSESFTATTGNCSTPSFAMALSRMTPVVVSSVEPIDTAHERFALGGGQRLHPAAHRRLQIVQPVQRNHVERTHEIGAVVHCDVGPVSERGAHVLVVGRVILTLDREHLDAVIAHQMRGHIVLGGEGIGRAQGDVRSAGLEGDGEIRGFGGDVKARRQTLPRERALAGKPLAEQAQDRHGAFGPFGATPPFGGEVQVLDVVGLTLRGRGHRATAGAA